MRVRLSWVCVIAAIVLFGAILSTIGTQWLDSHVMATRGSRARRSSTSGKFNTDQEVNELIVSLRANGNKALCLGRIVPGGERFQFSVPMIRLIRLRERARVVLQQYIKDPQIQNEVVLVLGAIGTDETVPLLIEAFPSRDNCALFETNSELRRKTVCFTEALTYLTGVSIGRDRRGSTFDPANRMCWQRWWQINRGTFVVPTKKPSASWVPDYRNAMKLP
ncbi:MAG: repeat protein [Planctomycetaceae bacterium]|nr:repeat protein [Planctomycetaceae bacterium]